MRQVKCLYYFLQIYYFYYILLLLFILFLTELSATSTLRKIPIITQIITYKTPTPNTKSCKTVKNTNLTVKNTNLCEIPRNITVGEWLDENNRTGEDDLCEDDVQIVSIENVYCS